MSESWLNSQYAQTPSGLNIATRDETIHSRDIKISTQDLLKSENPDLIKLGKLLEKNNQTLAINHHYFDDPPFAPMTPEKLKERLKDPKSIEYKNMMAMLFQFIVMILVRESYLFALDELYYQRRLYREFIANHRDYGRVAWDDEFPIHKRPDLQTSPNSTAHILELIRCEIASQAAHDYLFLSQFCPAGKEYVVRESIERRTQRRMGYADYLENTLNGKPAPKPHVVSLVEEQAAVFARNLELGHAVTQNRLLGDVIERLMTPAEHNSSVAANIEEITLKFEVAEQAFIEVNQRALERALKESQEPEVFAEQLSSYEDFSQIASQLNIKIGKVISDFYDDMGEKLDNAAPEEKDKFIPMMKEILKKEAGLLDLKMELNRVANTTVKMSKEYISEVQTKIQEIKNSTEDKDVAHDVMQIVKQHCGDQLDRLEQSMMRAYVAQLKADNIVVEEPEEKIQTEIKAFPYMHLPKVNSMMFKSKEEPNNDSFKNAFKEKLVETVKNSSEMKEEAELIKVKETTVYELKQCEVELNNLFDDEATKVVRLIEKLRATQDDNQIKDCLDKIKCIVDDLPNSKTDSDTQNQIRDALYKVHMFSNLVIEDPLKSLFNKSN